MNILPSIKEILTEAGITTSIKLSRMPDGKDTGIAIYDGGEIAPDVNDTASVDIQERAFQIMVRGANYPDVAGICQTIREALHNKIAVTTEAHYFLSIAATSGLQPITNEVGNYEFSGNFKCRVRAV